MTEEDEENFENVTEFWSCKQLFSPLSSGIDMHGKVYGKEREYCHLSVKDRSAARNACKFMPKFIAVVIHNLSGYDSHLAFKELIWRKNPEFWLNVTSKTSEFCIHYIRMFKGIFRK